MRNFILIGLILLTGCASMEYYSVVSPSESLYKKANTAYESQDYTEAIKLYKKFLEEKPKSLMATSAKLNLGMSYYYLEDYKQTFAVLRDVRVEDKNIKAYIDNILSICKSKATDSISVDEELQFTRTAKPVTTGTIDINVTEAFMNDFGDVTIVGKLDKPGTVTLDGTDATMRSNTQFSGSVNWRKGNPIMIAASDNSGNSSEIEYFPDREPPKEPENLRLVRASDNSIEIEWDENREEDIYGYRLFYRRQGGALKEVPDLIRGTRHEVIGLGNFIEGSNRTFEFYLRAVDRMRNESDDSEILEVDLPT